MLWRRARTRSRRTCRGDARFESARSSALRLLPATALWKAILVLGGSLLVAVAAQVRIDLPGSPVPVTGQTFAVLLVGAALGSRLGFLGLLAYLAEGSVGLPVFAGGTSAWSPSSVPGVPVAFGPTAGYLVGFAVAAFAVGWLAEHGWDRRVWTAMIAMLIGDAIVCPFARATATGTSSASENASSCNAERLKMTTGLGVGNPAPSRRAENSPTPAE